MSVPSDPWFDPGRRAHYLRHSRGNLRLADALCGWDRALRHALFIDVEELHHGVTATYAQAFETRWRGTGHWLVSPTGPLRVVGPLDLNERNRREIDEAVSLAPSPRSSEYEVLVKLSLGVWNVMTSARREHDLWVPYIRHAYPRGTRRGAAHYLVITLRRLRNRVCHHESLLEQAVAAQHQELDQLCGLLLPNYQKRFRADSQVAAVLRARPDQRSLSPRPLDTVDRFEPSGRGDPGRPIRSGVTRAGYCEEMSGDHPRAVVALACTAQFVDVVTVLIVALPMIQRERSEGREHVFVAGWDHRAVSQYFQVGELVLWNPSDTVARLFARMTEAMVPVAERPSGVGPDVGRDEYEIDLDAFAAFVDALTVRYLSTNHPVLTAMLEGYLPAALVMVQRGGRAVPALGRPMSPDNRDVSLRGAFDPGGDRQRLLGLAEGHARAMPH